MCVAEGSNYVHWIGLYLSSYLNRLLSSFVHGRPQNLQTSEINPCHNPLNKTNDNTI